MARPTKKNDKLLQEITERLSQGEPLAQICRDEGMPAARTVREWQQTDESVSAAIARAREEGFDAIAAECLRIADTPLPGKIEKRELLGVVKHKDEDGKEQSVALPEAELVVTEERTEDMLGHRKLQIETRLKLLAKWDPKRYGERLAVDHGVQDNLAERLRAARERATDRDA
ncbi:terminase [Stenotrophomonas maltophilia]|uniref:terminase small subunit-like protein n=1 Tax=Stenotrophomonas maltophilia TaxID=40324 RepID=UPI000D3985C3|nr:terminase [Stenotrophomonas maltophilia]